MNKHKKKIEDLANEFDYTQKTKHAYGKFWNERYPKNQLYYKRFSINKFEVLSKLLTPKQTMLDIGVGFGDSLYLFNKFYNELYGIDPSKEMYEIATYNLKERKIPKSNVSWQMAEKMLFKDSFFDDIFLLDVFEHFRTKDIKNSLNEIQRVMKQNGTLYIVTPSRYQIKLWTYFDNLLIKIFKNKKQKIRQTRKKDHTEIFYTAKEVKQILNKHGFKVKRLIKTSFYPAPEYPGYFQEICDKNKKNKIIMNIIHFCFILLESIPILRQKMLFIVKAV